MDLLTLSVGSTQLALLGPQVSFIEGWRETHARRVPLAQALGLAAAGDCTRAVVVDGPSGPVAFGVDSALQQRHAEPGSVVGVSRVLRRLRPPPWLVGFFLQDSGLALVVDLTQLSIPPETAVRKSP